MRNPAAFWTAIAVTVVAAIGLLILSAQAVTGGKGGWVIPTVAGVALLAGAAFLVVKTPRN
ncbi:hypothetical protein [Streptomyces uncialis]|uniref:Integral membrane protein n=1 Tax=Streptomyces uncialis TaxID=1048205 RepID=A0A1Q4V895_9ACTN|nr:hypothetical protein [Streptomyces uncialis]MCX4661877.1 hypothetical protein [Streptomyces uncialis]OKH94056.1 hypothetical protein AB852_15485 [Streptomyces uncialis]WTE09148.1 hypothetical protein OG924_01820 [Streptomyces uncialis]